MRASVDCRYVRERPSGIGRYVRALVDRLPALAPEDRFQVWVHPRAPRPLSGCPNVTETVVRAEANGPGTLLWPARLVDLRDVDVLHEPFNILGRGVPCATVVTVHDLNWVLDPAAAEPLSLLTPVRAAFYRDGIRRALRRATRIVAITQATADAIASYAPSASPRVRVVLHGVEPPFVPAGDAAAAQARAARILGTSAPFFLVVGQNAPYKNHEGVLEAFAASGLRSRARLVLLQRLHRSSRLARRARGLRIAGDVIWLGAASEGDIVALLQTCTALVQFSRNEGFGMPALEAMACGAPVVASDIPPLVEVTGGAGLHVPLQVPALAAAMRRVAAEPSLRAELSERGLARASELSWDRTAELHLEVYREAAAAGPLRPGR